MKLKKIILQSNQIEVLGTFLSHLFEMELESQGVFLTLTHENGIIFQLEESLEERSSNNTLIQLHFETIQELEALIQKIHFLQYRLELGNILLSDIMSDGEENYFEMTDFDNRVWRFSSI